LSQSCPWRRAPRLPRSARPSHEFCSCINALPPCPRCVGFQRPQLSSGVFSQVEIMSSASARHSNFDHRIPAPRSVVYEQGILRRCRATVGITRYPQYTHRFRLCQCCGTGYSNCVEVYLFVASSGISLYAVRVSLTMAFFPLALQRR